MKNYEYVLHLLQIVGGSTMFENCNDGMSLPLHISKKVVYSLLCEFEKIKNMSEKEFEELKLRVEQFE